MKKPVLLSLCALMALTAFAQESCPATVHLTAPLSQVRILEQASHRLTAANLVGSGEVVYQAGQSVSLTAGFEVKPGAVFEASIAACQPLNKDSASPVENILSLVAYPNPFAENTQIEYSLAQSSIVSISIVDMKGTLVAKLVSDQKQAEGAHRITFESKMLPEGTYICTLDTPTEHQMHKLIKTN